MASVYLAHLLSQIKLYKGGHQKSDPRWITYWCDVGAPQPVKAKRVLTVHFELTCNILPFTVVLVPGGNH